MNFNLLCELIDDDLLGLLIFRLLFHILFQRVLLLDCSVYAMCSFLQPLPFLYQMLTSKDTNFIGFTFKKSNVKSLEGTGTMNNTMSLP